MPDVILHHYDASPFSQKAQKMLGIKGLHWQSVEMPMTAPKPEIEAITGGYRGTPVLQVGNDVFVDTVAIADALDYFFPKPPLLSEPSGMESDAIGFWADQLFDAVLRAAVALYAKDWDAHFYSDRAAVFPNLDFEIQQETSPHMALRIARCAAQLNARLADGRSYLSGTACSLADVHCWGVLWFVRNGLPDLAADLGRLEHFNRWFDRLDDVGSGYRQESDYGTARAALEQEPVDPNRLPGGRPRDSRLEGWWDTPVAICAAGADRGRVTGTLVAQGDRLLTLRVDNEGLRSRQVHFPCSGYEITKV